MFVSCFHNHILISVIDHGQPDARTLCEMKRRIRWWQGEDRFGKEWYEWRKRNGARGGRSSSKREVVLRIWAVFGVAWRTSVMLALVRRASAASEASSRKD